MQGPGQHGEARRRHQPIRGTQHLRALGEPGWLIIPFDTSHLPKHHSSPSKHPLICHTLPTPIKHAHPRGFRVTAIRIRIRCPSPTTLIA